ncbi:DUF1501 domain-containing protein [Shimia abyssi]|uniref:Secreted protein n=1 Tax=Shimia abyssi TaxID=1662395 RepID=A0A2P8FJR0_9RHOB|nr:DUF1501 domain-containing protein [Shimia abyssi]PSL21950.1 secreted protein [Shimia abyssi]
MVRELTRRSFLGQGAMVGCSLAASPLMTSASFAAAPGQNRLIVIILRGGMDGLDILRPWGSAHLTTLRPSLKSAASDAMMLNEYYGLHPRLAALKPMWTSGELAFVQSVSTPYRDKRSHFDGQDILEAGTSGSVAGVQKDGWLNRMLSGLPGADATTAYSVGLGDMLLAQGPAEIRSWSPQVDVVLSQQGYALMQHMYQDDPALAKSLDQAVKLAGSDGDQALFEDASDGMMAAMDIQMGDAVQAGNKAHVKIADFVANQLAGDARIACFSLGGWDTHRNQKNALNRPAQQLADTLTTLMAGLGAAWKTTTVMCMTEFGRTAAENGSKGTDHGTGGMMILAGGAVRGRKIYGQFNGLDEAALYKRRDLMPTDDVRRWAAWVIRSSFGLEASFLERRVFPGLDLGADPGVLL